jgi:hypothetical protein
MPITVPLENRAFSPAKGFFTRAFHAKSVTITRKEPAVRQRGEVVPNGGADWWPAVSPVSNRRNFRPFHAPDLTPLGRLCQSAIQQVDNLRYSTFGWPHRLAG